MICGSSQLSYKPVALRKSLARTAVASVDDQVLVFVVVVIVIVVAASV